MKWKRSKKAQQEAKMSKEESVSDKRQSSTNTPQPTTKASSSLNQEAITNHVSGSENASCVRRIQEGESLYRPYVV